MEKINGNVYILGDNINTDDIIPSHTLTLRDPHQIAKYTLEFVDPNFIKNANEKTIIFAGDNFGTGSSREEAVNVFKLIGIKAIVARSFARIYYRNLINNGIPAITLNWKREEFNIGDFIHIDLIQGEISNKTKNTLTKFSKIPSFILEILKEGGIINRLRKTLKNRN